MTYPTQMQKTHESVTSHHIYGQVDTKQREKEPKKERLQKNTIHFFLPFTV